MEVIRTSADTSLWKDIGAPLILAFFAAAVAAFWPWIQAYQRGRRFQHIIRRELEEIGPYPTSPNRAKPWWDHATKRFIHEELLNRRSIAQNRDFLLSLDPTVVYLASQLWIALEKRDGRQWLHFLGELANNPRVGSENLRHAYARWEAIIDVQPEERLETMGIPTAFRQGVVTARAPQLFEARRAAYADLLPLTEVGPRGELRTPTGAERRECERQLTAWFYAKGAGLLLSGRAMAQFQKVRETVRDENTSAAAVHDAFSKLRTDLKIDLGVRQAQERDIALAWPEEERW